MSDQLLDYDYSRSFVQWTDDYAHHSPRCALHASCKLRAPDGTTQEYFLSHPCAGEKMYAERGLIVEPVCEFHFIFAPGDQYMMVKVFAGDPIELRMDHRIGERVATHDGKGAVLLRIDSALRRFPQVRELRTDRAVYEAMIANLPVLGRTSFTGDDGATEVVCEYPVTVMNARHPDQRWQVDTGPILIPDFSLKPKLSVGMFRQAYIVYNSWDWAEVALRVPTSTPRGDKVMHYTSPRRITVRNQLFVAVI